MGQEFRSGLAEWGWLTDLHLSWGGRWCLGLLSSGGLTGAGGYSSRGAESMSWCWQVAGGLRSSPWGLLHRPPERPVRVADFPHRSQSKGRGARCNIRYDLVSGVGAVTAVILSRLHSLVLIQCVVRLHTGANARRRWALGAVLEAGYHTKALQTVKKAGKPLVCLGPAFQEEKA